MENDSKSITNLKILAELRVYSQLQGGDLFVLGNTCLAFVNSDRTIMEVVAQIPKTRSVQENLLTRYSLEISVDVSEHATIWNREQWDEGDYTFVSADITASQSFQIQYETERAVSDSFKIRVESIQNLQPLTVLKKVDEILESYEYEFDMPSLIQTAHSVVCISFPDTPEEIDDNFCKFWQEQFANVTTLGEAWKIIRQCVFNNQTGFHVKH